MVKSSLKISIIIYTIFTIIYFVSCVPDKPINWPSDNTVIQHILWEIPYSDSQKVMIRTDNCWMLPEPSETDKTRTHKSTHRTPQMKKYVKYLGRVDQEIVDSSMPDQVSFYRFEKGSPYFLGFTAADSAKALTYYDPPLMLLPQNFRTVPSEYESVGTTYILNKETGKVEKGQKNKVQFNLKEKGCVLLDSVQVDAYLCEMSLSSDRTVGFGETDLIVPDAVLLKSNLIIAEGQGAILEWGIRSRQIGTEMDRRSAAERELYIEITRHSITKLK